MNKKNWKAFVLGLLFIVFDLAGCSNTDTSTKQEEASANQSQSQSNVDNNQTADNFSNTDFDFELKTVLLNSGYEMPIIGLGTWTQDDETVENSVYHALKDGYRLIDTANMYGNEAGVGK